MLQNYIGPGSKNAFFQCMVTNQGPIKKKRKFCDGPTNHCWQGYMSVLQLWTVLPIVVNISEHKMAAIPSNQRWKLALSWLLLWCFAERRLVNIARINIDFANVLDCVGHHCKKYAPDTVAHMNFKYGIIIQIICLARVFNCSANQLKESDYDRSKNIIGLGLGLQRTPRLGLQRTPHIRTFLTPWLYKDF